MMTLRTALETAIVTYLRAKVGGGVVVYRADSATLTYPCAVVKVTDWRPVTPDIWRTSKRATASVAVLTQHVPQRGKDAVIDTGREAHDIAVATVAALVDQPSAILVAALCEYGPDGLTVSHVYPASMAANAPQDNRLVTVFTQEVIAGVPEQVP
jgi:hypothetical protein